MKLYINYWFLMNIMGKEMFKKFIKLIFGNVFVFFKIINFCIRKFKLCINLIENN